MTKTLLEREAYEQGRRARANGVQFDLNPYRQPGLEFALGLNGQQTVDGYRAWSAGWRTE